MQRVLSVLLLVATLHAMSTPASGGEPGSAGLLFLRSGVDARSAGLGETGVASATDASAVYWNPALLAQAPGTQIGLQHMEMYDLFRMEAVYASHATPYGNFGLLLSGFYSDEVQRTELDRVGEVLGTFQPYDLVGGLAWGQAFGTVMIGITGKAIYERIDAYSGTAFAVDLGIAHDTQIDRNPPPCPERFVPVRSGIRASMERDGRNAFCSTRNSFRPTTGTPNSTEAWSSNWSVAS
jgi:hypothetical protein